ncbi:MAG: Trk system potassium transporter TrkA [Planctomycetaceae bacterium]|nr:Trk system potassium transporter TrkA [Planctomycetaceae bacterium]
MNVVILGAGTVGTSIAQLLCSNQQDVCVVDVSRAALDSVEEQLDVQTVVGSACDAITLFQAGVQSADLCLCVTSEDEINLVGASLAKAMGARRSVARIFNPAIRDTSTFDYRRHFGIDRLLSLEYLTAVELGRGIRKQGLFAIESFARGGVEVQEVAVEPGSRAIGVPLRELDMPPGVRIGLISSETRTTIAGADDTIEAGDHVTLIGSRERLQDVKRLLQHRTPPVLNVVIAGGGAIGFHLARLLQSGRFKVLLMEADGDRCRYLADRLDQTTILHADATRQTEMEEARVGRADVFVAATGHDEDNIVCGVEARELGCSRIMSVVRRPDYANVLERLGIDVAVSPREVIPRQVLGMVETGPRLDRTILSGGEAEVWEMEVLPGAPITRAPLKELQLPHILIAAIEREEFVRVPGADDQLQTGDTAVVLVQVASRAEAMELFIPTN